MFSFLFTEIRFRRIAVQIWLRNYKKWKPLAGTQGKCPFLILLTFWGSLASSRHIKSLLRKEKSLHINTRSRYESFFSIGRHFFQMLRLDSTSRSGNYKSLRPVRLYSLLGNSSRNCINNFLS